jgi:phosphohistidine phosphatase
MKTVIFFRHGKSDWNSAFGHDHERPLNKRGRKAARRMGRFLDRIEQLPDRIISSSATRARMTFEQAAQKGDWGDIPVEITDDLYEASPADVLSVIQSISDGSERILLVGHEPTFSDTVGRLIGSANVRMPTAAMACIEIEVDHWPDVGFGSGQLRWLVGPKLL